MCSSGPVLDSAHVAFSFRDTFLCSCMVHGHLELILDNIWSLLELIVCRDVSDLVACIVALAKDSIWSLVDTLGFFNFE